MNPRRTEGATRDIPGGIIEPIEAHVGSRLGGQIHDFRVAIRDHGLAIQGRSRTQHARQLAQQAAMEITELPIVANEIRVLRSAGSTGAMAEARPDQRHGGPEYARREETMERFHGRLLEGERVLFGRVSGVYEERDDRGDRLGHLEIHEGSAPILDARRPYRLALENGRTDEISITGMRLSGLAGITLLAFRAPAGVMAEGR